MESIYTINVKVTGSYHCEVVAESEEDAVEKAVALAKNDLGDVLEDPEIDPKIEMVEHIGISDSFFGKPDAPIQTVTNRIL